MPLLADTRDMGWDVAGFRPARSATAWSDLHRHLRGPNRRTSELAAAAADYPTWLDRYLELPISVLPARVGELSNRLAADAANPYERASAIESHLRGLEYSTHVATPPPDCDLGRRSPFDPHR